MSEQDWIRRAKEGRERIASLEESLAWARHGLDATLRAAVQSNVRKVDLKAALGLNSTSLDRMIARADDEDARGAARRLTITAQVEVTHGAITSMDRDVLLRQIGRAARHDAEEQLRAYDLRSAGVPA